MNFEYIHFVMINFPFVKAQQKKTKGRMVATGTWKKWVLFLFSLLCVRVFFWRSPETKITNWFFWKTLHCELKTCAQIVSMKKVLRKILIIPIIIIRKEKKGTHNQKNRMKNTAKPWKSMWWKKRNLIQRRKCLYCACCWLVQ